MNYQPFLLLIRMKFLSFHFCHISLFSLTYIEIWLKSNQSLSCLSSFPAALMFVCLLSQFPHKYTDILLSWVKNCSSILFYSLDIVPASLFAVKEKSFESVSILPVSIFPLIFTWTCMRQAIITTTLGKLLLSRSPIIILPCSFYLTEHPH